MLVNLQLILTKTEEEKLLKSGQEQIIQQIHDRIQNNKKRIINLIQQYVSRNIRTAPEVKALESDYKFRYDLGVHKEEVVEVINQMIDIINTNIFFDISFGARRDYVRLNIGLVERKYENILAIRAAYFTSSGAFHIPWLRWLLFEGDRFIITTHHVIYETTKDDITKNERPRSFPSSRTGGAIMVKPGSFRIPPQWSGTIYDNFITRAVEGINILLLKELVDILS